MHTALVPLAAALLAATPAGTPKSLAALALEEALRELDAQNLTLAQAQARAEEARAVVRQSAAALLPTLSATGSYTRNSQEVVLQRP
ncbi:MAG TPA: TolC family protein, partial [Anaeromyxobacteraceae bacterium]|nr:TolC family protein [Anaeromyxobacteraceae bacterium]